MSYATIIIAIALLQYLHFTMRTGLKRNPLGVLAPKTTGSEDWERIFRVQQNTLEQLVVFVPAVIGFALFVSPLWVLLPGVLFVIGRQLYSMAYLSEPEKRGPGMALTFFSNLALVLGALVGAGAELLP